MILIIDDDPAVRTALGLLLRRKGYDVATAEGPSQAMATMRVSRPRLVVLDMNFTKTTSGDEGLTLLRQIKVFHPDVPVILITAWGSIDLAVEGMRCGAFDFITKPWDNRRMLGSVATALEMTEPAAPLPGGIDRCGMVGNHPALLNLFGIIERLAPTNAPVLVTGESGTGKELIAEAIHRNSRRAKGPFVKVNLGAMPPALFESEMFGHRKGAFTGAVDDRTGRFEAADGGTIFLDEIGELDAACQVKLLRVLQEQTFEPLGSNHTRRVDVRVVCATNADLREMVAAHRFREDLFYRINVVGIDMPPLRDRGDDIILLADHFLSAISRENGMRVPSLTPDAQRWLRTRPFPGNIRQLRNLMERAAILTAGDSIAASDLMAVEPQQHIPDERSGSLDDMEERHIRESFTRHKGNISRMARELGLSRAALYRRLSKYGIDT